LKLINHIKCIPFILLSLLLYGCPATHYKIFVRNYHTDSAYITIDFKKDLIEYYHKPWDSVKFSNDILEIDKHTLAQLNKTLQFSADSTKAILIIPPQSTAYITPFIEYPYQFAQKKLTIKTNNNTVSMDIKYPYKNIKWTTTKRGKSTYIHKTIFGYDIK